MLLVTHWGLWGKQQEWIPKLSNLLTGPSNKGAMSGYGTLADIPFALSDVRFRG
jgi:hypothetical protein